MKNFNKLSTFFILASMLLTIYSCEDNVIDNLEEENLSESIQKIETIYQEGDEKIEIYDSLYVKTETQADEQYLLKIQEELENSFSKQRVLRNNAQKVGVLKSGSCGSYATLEVFMDCEDRNPASYASGWTGSSYVNSNKNVLLSFCEVDGVEFNRTGEDYALLMLSNKTYWGDAQRIVRYFDNEDSGNTNSTKRNGSYISGMSGDCNFGTNTRLAFFHYKDNGSSSAYFPYLGIPYGVFGRFGPAQGSIYTDDEDSRNANWAITQSSYSASTINVSSVPNILSAGSNTRLYMSLAKYSK